jgi:DNA-directed RNA polymerase specialized sigma24 family protein
VEETATIIGKSAGAVKVLQNRAIKALRRHLEDRPTVLSAR